MPLEVLTENIARSNGLALKTKVDIGTAYNQEESRFVIGFVYDGSESSNVDGRIELIYKGMYSKKVYVSRPASMQEAQCFPMPAKEDFRYLMFGFGEKSRVSYIELLQKMGQNVSSQIIPESVFLSFMESLSERYNKLYTSLGCPYRLNIQTLLLNFFNIRNFRESLKAELLHFNNDRE